MHFHVGINCDKKENLPLDAFVFTVYNVGPVHFNTKQNCYLLLVYCLENPYLLPKPSRTVSQPL
jgi:hypothetical protein